MAIRLDKVMVVTNSDMSISNQVAQYYASARGLNTAHIQAYALGTNMGGYGTLTQGYTFIKSIGDYATANGIQCILFAPGVPHTVVAHQSTSTGEISIDTDCIAQISRYAATQTEANYRSNLFSNGLIDLDNVPNQLTGRSLSTPNEAWHFWERREGSVTPFSRDYFPLLENTSASDRFTPTGFIGWLYRANGEPAIANDQITFDRCKKIIDNAIAAEKTIGVQNPVHISVEGRDSTPPSGLNNITALQAALCRDMLTGWKKRLYGISGGDLQLWRPEWDAIAVKPVKDYIGSTNAGIVEYSSSQAETAWAFCGSSAWMNASWTQAEQFLPNYTVVKGCWGYESTSAPADWFNYLLLNYDAVAFCGVSSAEPFANGVHAVNFFLYHLLRGKTMAEANLLAAPAPAGRVRCWGDPLYKPFPRGQSNTTLATRPRNRRVR